MALAAALALWTPTAAALVLWMPTTAAAAEAAHGVEVLLPPSHVASKEPATVEQPGGEAEEDAAAQSRREPRIVVTAAPPPVAGWERAPTVEVVGLEDEGDVVVYSPAPEPMPAARRLDGVDIRSHRIGEAAPASRVTTHSWEPGAPSRIRRHDARTAEAARIPSSGSGSARIAQSWNPQGPRYEPSRIRHHGWSRARGDAR